MSNVGQPKPIPSGVSGSGNPNITSPPPPHSKTTAPIAPNPRNPNLPPSFESPLPLRVLKTKTFTEEDWIQEKYVDVLLEVGVPPTRIPGHRIILEESPVLKMHFKYRTSRDVLRLPNLNPLGCIEVIRWLYSGELDIQETCLQKFNHIVHAAALLELKQYLNFWSIRREAVRWKKIKLVDYIDDMIRQNYQGIVEGELFNQFEFEEVLDLIKIVAGHVSPIQLFNSIIQWIEVESKRGKYAESLLSLISIQDAFNENQEIVTRVFTDFVRFPYLKSFKSPEFKKEIENLMETEPQPSLKRPFDKDIGDENHQQPRKLTRRTSSTESSQHSGVGGRMNDGECENDNDSESSLECSGIIYKRRQGQRGVVAAAAGTSGSIDIGNIKIEPQPSISTLPENCKAGTGYFAEPEPRVRNVEIYEGHYGLLYPITIRGNTYLDAYDFKSQKHYRLHSVPSPRREYSSLVVAGADKLFDIGGTTDAAVSIWDDLRSSKLVQVFTKGEFNGKAGPPMRKALRVFGAVCYDDIIYVTGGDCTAREGTMVSSSLLQLNVSEANPRWLMKKPMFTPRSCHDIAVLDSDIYVVGGVGSDTDSAMKKAERYSTVYECWTKLPDLNTGRRCLRVIAWKNKILAMGGEMTVSMTDYRSLSSVEAFDPETNTWELMPPMKHGRKSFGVVVVDDIIYVIGGNAENVENYNIEKFDGTKWTMVDWPDVLNRHGKFISSAGLRMDYVKEEDEN